MNSTKNDLALAPDGLRLEITNGLHHGVELNLDDGEYSFGSNAEADIVLRDDGILKRHAVLRLDKGEAYLEAVGGTIYVDDVKIAIGHGCRAGMPAKLAIGDAVIRLIRQPGAKPRPGGRGASAFHLLSEHPIKVSGGLIGGAFAFVILANQFQPPGEQAADLPFAQGGFSETRNMARVASWELDGATAQKAYTALEERISSAGITTIQLALDDRRISAKGRITELQSKDWTSIQRWFDKTYSSSAILNANIETGELHGKAPVRLQAIWFGERPYIIPENNMRYYEGSVLESGWTVQKITSDRVVLAKNGETFALTYDSFTRK